MSKAILVIDMPESCDKCPLLFRHKEERCCWAEGRNSFTTKPSWCPLKSVPDKVEVFMDDWADSYNACLKEILGE